jgi:hypothetical protein
MRAIDVRARGQGEGPFFSGYCILGSKNCVTFGIDAQPDYTLVFAFCYDCQNGQCAVYCNVFGFQQLSVCV